MDSLIFEWNRLYARRQALVGASLLRDVDRTGAGSTDATAGAVCELRLTPGAE